MRDLHGCQREFVLSDDAWAQDLTPFVPYAADTSCYFVWVMSSNLARDQVPIRTVTTELIPRDMSVRFSKRKYINMTAEGKINPGWPTENYRLPVPRTPKIDRTITVRFRQPHMTWRRYTCWAVRVLAKRALEITHKESIGNKAAGAIPLGSRIHNFSAQETHTFII